MQQSENDGIYLCDLLGINGLMILGMFSTHLLRNFVFLARCLKYTKH